MKKLIKPASFLFYFLIVFVFFFLGIYTAKLTGAGKDQMLAGGAIVLFYGLASSAMALIMALFIAYRVSHSTIVKINKIVGILFFLLVILTAYNFITRDKKEIPRKNHPEKTNATVISPVSSAALFRVVKN